MQRQAQPTQLEEQLNHPDLSTRLQALRELKHLADAGKLATTPPRPWVNMHCHSFCSYNAHGFSPCRIAWEMCKRGVAVSGIVDFDVLDGLDEALAAGDALHSKFTVGLETRVYVKEFDNVVLSSPNEPAIAYYMGQGFTQAPVPNSRPAHTLRRMRESAAARNKAIMERVNAYLGDVGIAYETDVLPLTASGNATERHMLEAYDNKSKQLIPDRGRRAHFWAAKLLMGQSEVERMMDDAVRFRGVMRQRLMKYGSPGYAPPDPRNFPTHEEVVEMIRACGAMPMYAWLDGTSSGEEDTELLLDFFCTAGQVAINIIPDRNWNLRDPAEKAVKTARLNEIVAASKERNLPINAGTEMNKATQPLVDHFDSAELKPHVQTFLAGARIIWGHLLLLRHGGFGYLSPQAEVVFDKDLRRKNEFFRQVGALPVPHGAVLQKLRAASKDGDTRAVLRALTP